ncbi:glycosyltransferase family 2 protein [Opitutus terrae]|uniref:Glycosyl transferase family 2 n=1 Tax=Opitutus terrae (strain DSM 11246 / JCM 15787 / PB90-1) TaxID=452637 RepID=B1ZQ98_OPITP|nr:glycosyltransferase family 2 protein [Opitutus terrae]ACB73578.1 glycosyl transferase family 2 [Opitutus terrae PB90-1]
MSISRPHLPATTPPSADSRVCAVVVTYHPGPEVPANVEAILRQVDRVIVVDNEASGASRERLAPLRDDPAVEWIENKENLGIASAFNQGVARALADGFDWVATFDQDSLVPETYIADLLAAYDRHPDRERVAVVAPLYRDRYLGFVYSPARGPVPESEDGEAPVPVPVTASSGNLVSVAALRALGGFREDFFMACVDFEFCLRCRRAGWLVLEICGVVLSHAMGKYQQRRWLGLKPRINDYDAARRYYQARNLLILYANYLSFDPWWVIRDASRYGRDFIKLMLFCENRREKLGAVLLGGWHAVTGRRGRWPRALKGRTLSRDDMAPAP